MFIEPGVSVDLLAAVMDSQITQHALTAFESKLLLLEVTVTMVG